MSDQSLDSPSPMEVAFRLNGEERRIHAPTPTRTLLEWLREDAGCVGVKEGCAEGDCGACTVLARGPDRLHPLNACILLLPMADGLDLVTVEGLSSGGTELHPVQAAMVERHASQCGFCTPGFVMALAAWAGDREASGEADLRDSLAGNLCRCTGYGPILEAGRDVKKAPFPSPEPARASALPPRRTAPLSFEAPGGGTWRAPHELEELLALRAAFPEAVIVGGATDIGLWVTKQQRELPALISTRRVAELQAIEETGEGLVLGAAVTYAQAMPALARLHRAFGPYLRRIGGPQVRESGTIGGNIANGSPIGDMPPALIALGAEIELASLRGTRRLALEDYFIAYGRQDLHADEVLVRVHAPRPPPSGVLAFEKLSKRPDQDISSVALGMFLRLEGGLIAAARIAFGGLAGTPKRAASAEAALTGARFALEAFDRAAAAIEEDFTPLSDHRASAAYRRAGAGGLLRRAYLRESGDPAAPGIHAFGQEDR